ncbi:hypothetical protein J3E69DRAFT_23607 [Trichoderma sp. SZMC 28015]
MKARKEVLETWESPTAAVLQHQRINASISTHDQVSLKGGYTTAFPVVKRVHDCNDHWSCAKRASKPAEGDGPLSIRSIIRLAKPTHYQVIMLASILLFFYRLTFVEMRTARSLWLWTSLTHKQADQPHGKFEPYLCRHAAPIGSTTSATCCLSFSFYLGLCVRVCVQMGKGGKMVSHLSQIMLPQSGYQAFEFIYQIDDIWLLIQTTLTDPPLSRYEPKGGDQ